MTRTAVLGAGSWGTAFAKVLADAGTPTVLWARRPELAACINERHENADYLPGLALPASLSATHDPEEALSGAEIVVLAVPSQTLRDNLGPWAGLISGDATLVSLMKGVELGTHKLMSEVICEVGKVERERVAVVSGPNLAREIAREQPTATVVACEDVARATQVQQASTTIYFRPYTNVDVIGVELGGALKNVIALACGIAQGLGYDGDNTMASVITRGLAETTRLGEALGADPRTFAGLAGMGDLVATCTSPLSRNRTFGEKVGRGVGIEEILAESHQVAEGYKSCRSILELGAAHGVELPIVHHVVQVLHEGLPPRSIVTSLMGRSAGAE